MRASCCSLDISDRVSPLPRALSIAYSLQPLLSGELGTVHSQCHTQRPQEQGKFRQDAQHLPAAPGRRRGPAGREAALTWHTKAAPASGGRRRSQVRGPRRERRRGIPAAPEPRAYPPPRAAFSPPPAAPGALSRLWLGAGGPGAGEGGSWWRPGPVIAPPREGGSPARGGDSPTGRGARVPVPVPGLPAAGSPALPPGIALCK
uniref:Uncharacterized protein n=1 Tax=Rangifer tarandus platyrhynchus TaxID=3082113 RepID=A0ACB0E961_RANTA|nr:unnamed protein product [Rangifer tarandus platyrhynchus]